MNDLRLPDGTRLLHIGPHKTGTTALQGSLRQARAVLTEYGVIYPGAGRQHSLAARAVCDGRGPKGDPLPSMRDWDRLVAQVVAAGDRRVIVSSESFANAETETARVVVEQLGGPRVHVLVTLRPLTKILPSAWQQYVREGLPTSYEDWLDGMLSQPPYNRPTPTFWRRHRHDDLVERWASVVGADRLTVIVVDDSDRLMLMRTVEQLVGLPTGVIELEPGVANRSLTFGEIELVRHLNTEFQQRGWSDDLYRTFIRSGMTQQLQRAHQPGPDEPRITTPTWALERAATIGAEATEKIASLGVRIVGDTSTLGSRPDPAATIEAPASTLPLAVAKEAVTGAIAAGISQLEGLGLRAPVSRVGAASAISTRDMSGIILRRAARRARRWLAARSMAVRSGKKVR